MPEKSAVQLARRIGMSTLLVLIAWTIGAVAVGVLRGAIEPAGEFSPAEPPPHEVQSALESGALGLPQTQESRL